MSSAPEGRPELLDEVARKTSRVSGQGALFVQAVAERLGLAPSDVECLRLLADGGAMAIGRLGELSSLSAGATTRMVDRLEQAGYVRRSTDPADRRRIIVEPVSERVAAIAPFIDSMVQSMREAVDAYRDDELITIRDFLDRALRVTTEETGRLREAPATGEAGPSAFAAPVGSVRAGRLVFLSGAPNIRLLGDPGLGDLYRARFQGPVPRVRVRDGTVTVRYGRLSWFDWRARVGEIMLNASVHWRTDRGEIALNTSVPWAIELRGGLSKLSADLRALTLESIELAGGASSIDLMLPRPRGVVPVRIAGGCNRVAFHRPAGVAARIRVAGGVTTLTLDGERVKGPHDVVLQPGPGGRAQRVDAGSVSLVTAGADAAADRYDLELAGGAHRVVIDQV